MPSSFLLIFFGPQTVFGITRFGSPHGLRVEPHGGACARCMVCLLVSSQLHERDRLDFVSSRPLIGGVTAVKSARRIPGRVPARPGEKDGKTIVRADAVTF